MIRLLINGLAASAGGGLTYLRNVIPHLARRGDAEATVLPNPAIRAEFGELRKISFVQGARPCGVDRRFVREQTGLPKLIRRSGAQVLISAGNFALWDSPVPQILLSRKFLFSALLFCRMFYSCSFPSRVPCSGTCRLRSLEARTCYAAREIG